MRSRTIRRWRALALCLPLVLGAALSGARAEASHFPPTQPAAAPETGTAAHPGSLATGGPSTRGDAGAIHRAALDRPGDTPVASAHPTLRGYATVALLLLQGALILALVLHALRRRAAGERARAARAQLAPMTRRAAMDEMTASIAHEVNQPLAAIVANANAARRWLDRPEPDLGEARAALERIAGDGLRAAEVIATMRQTFRAADGARVAIDLADLVRDALLLARAEIEDNGVTMRTRLDPGLPPILGNRAQLQQLVLSLVAQALDALQAGPRRSRQLSVTLARDGAEGVALSVSDTGPERLSDDVPGLSICRAIVAAHDGTLSVRRGSEVVVRLPAAPAATETSP
jgi:signal transduction histidine kinase